MAEASDAFNWPTEALRRDVQSTSPKQSESTWPKQSESTLSYSARSPAPDAFDGAARHSAKVRFLRWMLGGLCLVATPLVFLGAIVPSPAPPETAMLGNVSVDGGLITVQRVRVSGLEDHGRPYQLMARSGFHDPASPDLAELQGVDATIGLNDASALHVTAGHGAYNGTGDYLKLDGSIEAQSNAGYGIFMKKAQVDFKTGVLSSREPVRAVLIGGSVAANQLDVENDGRISFEGEVRSIIGAR